MHVVIHEQKETHKQKTSQMSCMWSNLRAVAHDMVMHIYDDEQPKMKLKLHIHIQLLRVEVECTPQLTAQALLHQRTVHALSHSSRCLTGNN